jgi:hypothetical protein
MPNWCSNSITITGPVEKIHALRAVSIDKGLLEAMAPLGDWEYDRAVEAWGTKWDISNEGLEYEDNGDGTATIGGWADSAWAPPVEAFQTYSNANPEVTMELQYFEPGMAFIGVWDNTGGDAYWDKLDELLDTTAEEDPVLYGLLEDFNVWDWYEPDEENLEIDLDGGLSAINEE